MSLYRNTTFIIKGLQEFTKSGYEKASVHFKPDALNVNLEGKVFIVTGASSGLGKLVATDVAKRGATVHIICRNEKKGEEATEDIKKKAKNDKVHLHIVDLSKMKDIQNFITKFKEISTRLDVLVNNGGAMINDYQLTEEGLEVNFATNTLSAFFLTNGLIDLLSNGKPSRVVTVSSGGMYTQRLNVDDLLFQKMKPFDGTFAYAQNKRQQVILSELWQKKYGEKGITFYSCHPGWADTPAVAESMPSFYNTMKDKLRTVEQGADTITYLSIAKEIEKEIEGGSFVQDRQPVSKHLPLAWTTNTDDESNALWNKSLEYLKTIVTKEFLELHFTAPSDTPLLYKK